jgi:hypothetical protein
VSVAAIVTAAPLLDDVAVTFVVKSIEVVLSANAVPLFFKVKLPEPPLDDICILEPLGLTVMPDPAVMFKPPVKEFKDETPAAEPPGKFSILTTFVKFPPSTSVINKTSLFDGLVFSG